MINKEIISKADKGNSILITYQDNYYNKILDFIANNNLAAVNIDSTKTLQRSHRSLINECQTHKEEKWKYLNLNPSAPTIRGLMKIYKIDPPIRPVFNWKNAPAYKLPKILARKLQV